MLDLSTFLTRWLFLSNMARDSAEIQTLPFQPFTAAQHPSQSPRQIEELWKDQCIRGVLSYPPGDQRLMVMDALRVELVQTLAKELENADETIRQHRLSRMKTLPNMPTKQQSEMDDPYLDADVEILKEFGANAGPLASSESPVMRKARLIVSGEGANIQESDSEAEDSEAGAAPTPPSPTREQVIGATNTLRSVREHLPQLVSAVLKSPPAHDDSPIHRLRETLLDRCLKDPSWGIELCWLLEAEVGRAWKTLFEHRQQTGRRLIVVLPAEKAAVLAQIGSEKRETFDLLQDAEQATAYGYKVENFNPHNQRYKDHDRKQPRLPSSLSLRRCSHFGDTMHFIDRLTTISLDLRKVPTIERDLYLKNSLYEMNRRIRRRMATQGEISIDVEDHRTPSDWPTLEDVSDEVLHHSVHFPLVPQTGVWPNGEENSHDFQSLATPDVVRVLNIVVPESRILASRERCPYLLHVEVAETGLDGSDARLYTGRSDGLGTTMEEALSMSGKAASVIKDSVASYAIPDELSRTQPNDGSYTTDEMNLRVKTTPLYRSQVTRGGGQGESTMYGECEAGYSVAPDYRETQYQQLHEELHTAPQVMTSQPEMQVASLSFGTELLDQVFGELWKEKCKSIKAASPYGHVKGWRLASFILKAGEDIRREALVMQIISKFRTWFQEIPETFRPYMRPYTIMCVGGDAGLVECLSDAKSIDEVKKKTDGFSSLRAYFERAYGPSQPPGRLNTPGSVTFEEAQDNFLRSLVGYSLVCYVLQIKDRHNANILLDREGHIMHIDFGFVLGDTPKMSKVPIFTERAPFKLTQEFWEILGGWDLNSGGLGVRFCQAFEKAFECASNHVEEIASLVESTVLTLTSNARLARRRANEVRHRLLMRGRPGSKDQKHFIMNLVNAALASWGSTTYDWLQQQMNGYQ